MDIKKAFLASSVRTDAGYACSIAGLPVIGRGKDKFQAETNATAELAKYLDEHPEAEKLGTQIEGEVAVVMIASKKKYSYEIRKIDAWGNSEEGWTWNNSIHISDLETRSEDHKRAFVSKLRKLGVDVNLERLAVEYDGDVYELCNKETGEPLYAAVPNW